MELQWITRNENRSFASDLGKGLQDRHSNTSQWKCPELEPSPGNKRNKSRYYSTRKKVKFKRNIKGILKIMQKPQNIDKAKHRKIPESWDYNYKCRKKVKFKGNDVNELKRIQENMKQKIHRKMKRFKDYGLKRVQDSIEICQLLPGTNKTVFSPKATQIKQFPWDVF